MKCPGLSHEDLATKVGGCKKNLHVESRTLLSLSLDLTPLAVLLAKDS